jgi:Cdc6-like AAA superfamily ATPase
MASTAQSIPANNELLSMLTNNRMFGGNNIYSFKELLLNILRDIIVNNVKDHINGISLKIFIIISLGLLSIMEFKDPIKNFITNKSKTLFDYLLLINYRSTIMHIKYSLNNWRSKLSRNSFLNELKNQPKQIVQVIPKYSYKYEWVVNPQFLNSFYYFIKNSSQCKYIEQSSKIETKSLQESIITCTYDKLVIKLANMNQIKIKNQLVYGINIIKNIPIHSGTIHNRSAYVDLLGDQNLVKLLQIVVERLIIAVGKKIGDNKPLKDIVIALHNIYYVQYGYSINEPFIQIKNIHGINDVVLSICADYPNFDKYETWLYIFSFDYIFTRNRGKSLLYVCICTKTCLLNPNKPTIVDTNISFPTIYAVGLDILNFNIDDLIGNFSQTIKYLTALTHSLTSYNVINGKYWIGDYSSSDMTSKSNESTKLANIVQIEIITQSPISNCNRNIIINELIKTINNFGKPDTSKIKTFDIGMLKNIQTIKKPNPEYLQWENRKNKLTDMSINSKKDSGIPSEKPNQQKDQSQDNKDHPDQSNNGVIGGKIMEKLVFSMPEESIEVTEEKFELYCNQINEDYTRTLDTLYLQEECENNLMSTLEIFRDRKDDMIQLGIKHKLNIMLHGLPGTGKTTTIHAVASYLQRDIYYLNLNEIRTNQQLKDIFDYMSKTVAKGGIVVIEDIDAMTPVVLDRTKFNNVNHNTDLTLEYFLNILQGTLTRDNSIFIITTNHLEKLDQALIRAGRFDCLVELKYANHYQISKIYKRILNRTIPIELMKKIPEYKYSPADFIHHFIRFILNTPSITDDKILEKFTTDIHI